MPTTTRQQLRKGPSYRQNGRRNLNESIDSTNSLPYGYQDEDDRTIVVEDGGGISYRKGTQQDDATLTDDLHLSIEEMTATGGDKSQYTVIGTSFLDRPWQPPMDTTTESGESLPGDEVIGCGLREDNQHHHHHHHDIDISSNGITQSRSHIASSINNSSRHHTNQSRGRRPAGDQTAASPPTAPSQSPSGALPSCAACKKSILGKYYEKDGLSVHVECFRDFLKESKKSQTSNRSTSKRSRSGGRGRKSPHPRRAPPVPVKREPLDVNTNNNNNTNPPPDTKASPSPDARSRGPSSGSVDAPYRTAAPSMGPYLPRDSDGSGSWLAHPSSLEPFQNRSGSQLPKPLSPPTQIPAINTSVPSTTVNNLRGGGGGSINQNVSLTLSPEGKATQQHEAADELLIGAISPIKELEQVHQQQQQQQPLPPPLDEPNPYQLTQTSPDAMEVLDEEAVDPNEMSACSSISESPYGGGNLPRVSEGTPIQQRVLYNNTNRSTPPSKALSTKLESPATPTPGSEHSLGGSLLYDDLRTSGAKAPLDPILSGGSGSPSAWVSVDRERVDRTSYPPVENAPLEISMVSQGVVTDSPPRNCTTRYRASVTGSFCEEINERIPTPKDVIFPRRSASCSRSPPTQTQRQPSATPTPPPPTTTTTPMADLLLDKTTAPRREVAKKAATAHQPTTTILQAEIAKYRLQSETAALREQETQSRLDIISEQMVQSPEWMAETSRILKELIATKVEMATIKTNMNPLSAIRLVASNSPSGQVPPPAITHPKAGWSPRSGSRGTSPIESPTAYKSAPRTPQRAVPGPIHPINSLAVNEKGNGLRTSHPSKQPRPAHKKL